MNGKPYIIGIRRMVIDFNLFEIKLYLKRKKLCSNLFLI